MGKTTSVTVDREQVEEIRELIFQKAWLGYRSVAEYYDGVLGIAMYIFLKDEPIIQIMIFHERVPLSWIPRKSLYVEPSPTN